MFVLIQFSTQLHMVHPHLSQRESGCKENLTLYFSTGGYSLVSVFIAHACTGLGGLSSNP